MTSITSNLSSRKVVTTHGEGEGKTAHTQPIGTFRKRKRKFYVRHRNIMGYMINDRFNSEANVRIPKYNTTAVALWITLLPLKFKCLMGKLCLRIKGLDLFGPIQNL